ncbi:MAG TPA: hypothetical protein VLE20_02600, partial [Blastocatellia bacterium]|nr:hypothetical protein [Blastocatellia bacterium]
SYRGFYQQIAAGLMRTAQNDQVSCELGDGFVLIAERAHAFRRMDILERVSQALVNLPGPRRYETVGNYYQALCVQNFGLGDAEGAANLLGRITEIGPPRYRIRALISLAANSRNQRDNQTALSLYCEANRYASCVGLYDAYAAVLVPRMVAVINSDDGDHRGALSLLEDLFPLAQTMRRAQPHVYCDYMNSLAVELCAVGRLEEAKNASEIALASPFAPAYPEWHETRYEIELRRRRASRSTVGVNHPVTVTAEPIASNASPEAQPSSPFLAEPAVVSVDVNHAPAEASNVLRFPVRGQNVGSVLARSSTGTSEPARVIVMSDRNKAVGRDSSTTTHVKKSYGDLDGRQLLLKIMELTAARDITDYELLEILESIESILYKQKDPGKP